MRVVRDEKQGKEISSLRKDRNRANKLNDQQVLKMKNFIEQPMDSSKKLIPLIVKGDVHGSVEAIRESLLKLTVLTSPVSTFLIEARYCSFTSRICCKESVLYASLVAFFFKAVEEYPGIYSRSGVKAIIKVVAKIRNNAKRVLKTNTFSLLSLNEKRSSKVSSFKITKRYLCKSFFLNFLALFSFWVIICNCFLQI